MEWEKVLTVLFCIFMALLSVEFRTVFHVVSIMFTPQMTTVKFSQGRRSIVLYGSLSQFKNISTLNIWASTSRHINTFGVNDENEYFSYDTTDVSFDISKDNSFIINRKEVRGN